MIAPTKLPHCATRDCGRTATRGKFAPALCRTCALARDPVPPLSFIVDDKGTRIDVTEDDERAAQKFDEQIRQLVKQ